MKREDLEPGKLYVSANGLGVRYLVMSFEGERVILKRDGGACHGQVVETTLSNMLKQFEPEDLTPELTRASARALVKMGETLCRGRRCHMGAPGRAGTKARDLRCDDCPLSAVDEIQDLLDTRDA